MKTVIMKSDKTEIHKTEKCANPQISLCLSLISHPIAPDLLKEN